MSEPGSGSVPHHLSVLPSEVVADAIDTLRAAVEREYPARTGREAGFHVVSAVAGAGLLEVE